MYCSEIELKKYICQLAEKVDSIEETMISFGRALDGIPNQSVLIKRGINSFLEDISRQIDSYKALSADVEDFTIKEK